MSPRFKTLKNTIRQELATTHWPIYLESLSSTPAIELVNPLIACLPLGGIQTQQAAKALGITVARLTKEMSVEDARNIIRRLMWHMNEESGNIGWGIPEAFAEILICNRTLAEEFHYILISYIIDTGNDDNYCDQDILRRSCYDAVGRLAEVWPDLAIPAIPYLKAGLDDHDPLCKEKAKKALEVLSTKQIPM